MIKHSDIQKIISLLFDTTVEKTPDFTEISDTYGAGVTTVYGKCKGFSLYAFFQNITENAGAINIETSNKIARVFELAVATGSPIIGVFDSKGADLKDGSALIASYNKIISESVKLSGVAPRIAIIKGVCVGLQAVIAQTFDFVITTKDCEFYSVSPFIDSKAMPIAKDFFSVENIEDAVSISHKLLSLLPKNNLSEAIYNDHLKNFAPITEGMVGFEIIEALSSKYAAIELYPQYSENAVAALSSIDSRPVSFIYYDKILNSKDLSKAARLITLADSFNLPIINILNTEGFCPNCKNTIKNAAQLSVAYASATVPKINIIVGNAIGASYIAVSNADITIAAQGSVISAVKPLAACVIENYKDQKSPSELEKEAALYAENNASAEIAAKHQLVQKIVPYSELRETLSEALNIVYDKRELSPARKHVNFIY